MFWEHYPPAARFNQSQCNANSLHERCVRANSRLIIAHMKVFMVTGLIIVSMLGMARISRRRQMAAVLEGGPRNKCSFRHHSGVVVWHSVRRTRPSTSADEISFTAVKRSSERAIESYHSLITDCWRTLVFTAAVRFFGS